MSELDRFDPGLLNDYGGGDTGWWLDYIRALLDSAHDHYSERAVDALESLTAENADLRLQLSGYAASATQDGNDIVQAGLEIESLTAERDRLREALEPFERARRTMFISGHCGGASPQDWPEDQMVHLSGPHSLGNQAWSGHFLYVRDFTRARTALKEKTSG